MFVCETDSNTGEKEADDEPFSAFSYTMSLQKTRLLYLCTAEAEQAVTKDSSKNRSSAFPRPVSGRFVLPRSRISQQVWALNTLSSDLFNLLLAIRFSAAAHRRTLR